MNSASILLNLPAMGLALCCLAWLLAAPSLRAQPSSGYPHRVQPGDTWAALAIRYALSPDEVQATKQSINPYRQPIIGHTLTLPRPPQHTGRLQRMFAGGLLSFAAQEGLNPWQLTQRAAARHPFYPSLYRPLLLSNENQVPRDWPAGLQKLDLSAVPAQPGTAVALRAVLTDDALPNVALNKRPWTVVENGRSLIALGATGAFFGSGAPELLIHPPGQPAWSQPWQFVDRNWTYQDLTLTGTAAAITQAEIEEENAHLASIWSEVTAVARFTAPFQLPLQDYVELSADYGGRRSYNGGPYRTYHEGVDFSAFGGTPVYAPAAGQVMLAEPLAVRGGAVILDHGLGIHTGYYHLSAVDVTPGQFVTAGQMLGRVGTTGLSTGNHLHWDLLVNGIQVDALEWRASGMACWLRHGLGQLCGATPRLNQTSLHD